MKLLVIISNVDRSRSPKFPISKEKRTLVVFSDIGRLPKRHFAKLTATSITIYIYFTRLSWVF